MKKVYTIEEAKELVSHFQSFIIDITNKELKDYVKELQDIGECEIDVNYEKKLAIIYVL